MNDNDNILITGLILLCLVGILYLLFRLYPSLFLHQVDYNAHFYSRFVYVRIFFANVFYVQRNVGIGRYPQQFLTNLIWRKTTQNQLNQ